MDVRTKRIYDPPRSDDGTRVLVDRLWPRGVSKTEVELDAWLREVAPSDDLREWFDHDPERWEGFLERYREELRGRPEVVDELEGYARNGRLTLLYAASDTEHNNAVALRQLLED